MGMKGTSWAHVQEVLSDLVFPATRDEIVAHAMDSQDADSADTAEAVQLLRQLPPATYRDISEVRAEVPAWSSDTEVDRP
jgi:hypothetical protein